MAEPDKEEREGSAVGVETVDVDAVEDVEDVEEKAADPPPSQFADLMFGGGSASAPVVSDAGPGTLRTDETFNFSSAAQPAEGRATATPTFPVVTDAGPGSGGDGTNAASTSDKGKESTPATGSLPAVSFGILAAAAKASGLSEDAKASGISSEQKTDATEDDLYCSLCDVKCSDKTQFASHVAGKKHAKRKKPTPSAAGKMAATEAVDADTEVDGAPQGTEPATPTIAPGLSNAVAETVSDGDGGIAALGATGTGENYETTKDGAKDNVMDLGSSSPAPQEKANKSARQEPLAAPKATAFGVANKPQFGAPASFSGGSFKVPSSGFTSFGAPSSKAPGDTDTKAPTFGKTAFGTPGASAVTGSFGFPRTLASFGSGAPVNKPVSFSAPQSLPKPKLNAGAPTFTPLGKTTTFGLPVKEAVVTNTKDSESLPTDAPPPAANAAVPIVSANEAPVVSKAAKSHKETTDDEEMLDSSGHSIPVSDSATATEEKSAKPTAEAKVPEAAAPSPFAALTPPKSSVKPFLPAAMEKESTAIDITAAAGVQPAEEKLVSAVTVSAPVHATTSPKSSPADSTVSPKEPTVDVLASATSKEDATPAAAKSVEAIEPQEISATPALDAALPPTPRVLSMATGSSSSAPAPSASDTNSAERELVCLPDSVALVIIKRRDTGRAFMKRRPTPSTVRVVTGGAKGPGVEFKENGSLWLFLKAGKERLKFMRSKKRDTVILTRLGSEEPGTDTPDNPVKMGVLIQDEGKISALLAAMVEAESEASTMVPAAASQETTNPAAASTSTAGKLSRDEDLKQKKLAALNSLRKKIRKPPAQPATLTATTALAASASAKSGPAVTKPFVPVPAVKDPSAPAPASNAMTKKLLLEGKGAAVAKAPRTYVPDSAPSVKKGKKTGEADLSASMPVVKEVKHAPLADPTVEAGKPGQSDASKAASATAPVSTKSVWNVLSTKAAPGKRTPFQMETEMAETSEKSAMVVGNSTDNSTPAASASKPFTGQASVEPRPGSAEVSEATRLGAGAVASAAPGNGKKRVRSGEPISVPNLPDRPAGEKEASMEVEPMDTSNDFGMGSEKPQDRSERTATTSAPTMAHEASRGSIQSAKAYAELPNVGEKRSASEGSPVQAVVPKKVKFALTPVQRGESKSAVVPVPSSADAAHPIAIAAVGSSEASLPPITAEGLSAPQKAMPAPSQTGATVAPAVTALLSNPVLAPSTERAEISMEMKKYVVENPVSSAAQSASTPLPPHSAATESAVVSPVAASAAASAAAVAKARAEWESEKKILLEQSSKIPELNLKLQQLTREASDAASLATTLQGLSAVSNGKLQEVTAAREREAGKSRALSQELLFAVEESRAMKGKYRSWLETGTAVVRMECRPESADDFNERLYTFRPSSWHAFGEVGKICPVQCAMHGWFNSGTNMLTSTDGAVVVLDADVLTRSGVAQYQAEVARVRDAITATGHSMLSPWIGASCPESFCAFGARRLSASAMQSHADVVRRCGVSGVLPPSSVDAHARAAAAKGEDWGEDVRDEASALAAEYWTVVSLPVTGRGVLECHWCRALHPIPNEDGGQEVSGMTDRLTYRTKGNVAQHYAFCPLASGTDVATPAPPTTAGN